MQFFMVIAAPVAGWYYPQFVPSQVTLLSQPAPHSDDTCPTCRTTLSLGWKFCPQCGANIICPGCKARLQPVSKYCSNCGRALRT